MTAHKRAWHLGAVNFWFKDIAIASYSYPALIMMLCTPLLVLLDPVLLNIAILFSLICMYCALAQQSIRLQATEWQAFVVQYRQHVMQQGKILILAINIFMLLIMALEQNIYLLSTLAVANTLGMAIWFICRVSSQWFTLCCYIVFLGAVIGSTLIAQLPLLLAPVAVLFCVTLALCKNKFGVAYRFNDTALVNYQNGVQSGWSPLPQGFSLVYTKQLNQFLFPLSYFVGPTLSQYLILIIGCSAGGILVNLFYDISEHALFILSNIIFTLFIFFHWSKAQRIKSWELLYTLPIYNSKAHAKRDLSHSAIKVTALLAGVCFIFSVMLYPNQLMLAVKFTLSCCITILASFVIANICKNGTLIGLFLGLGYSLFIPLNLMFLEPSHDLIKLISGTVMLALMVLLNRLTTRFI